MTHLGLLSIWVQNILSSAQDKRFDQAEVWWYNVSKSQVWFSYHFVIWLQGCPSENVCIGYEFISAIHPFFLHRKIRSKGDNSWAEGRFSSKLCKKFSHMAYSDHSCAEYK